MSKEVKYQEDYNLAHNYACGNTADGEILYSQVYDPLSNFVYSRTNGSKLTENQKEDIISESFLRSIDKLGFYNGQVPFKNFVIGIASNIIKEQFRKVKNDFILYEGIPDFDVNDVEDYYSRNPINILIEKEQIEEVHEILDLLPPDQKDIIIYRLFEGLAFDSIVKISGKSEAAVDSMYRRAIKNFKNKYLEIHKNSDGF